MTQIELIYDRDCPNVDDARAQLQAALAMMKWPLCWQEWERSDPDSPEHCRRYGSPTILIDGRDVAGELPVEAPSCRIYSDSRGRGRGVPGLLLIVNAMRETQITSDARPN